LAQARAGCHAEAPRPAGRSQGDTEARVRRLCELDVIEQVMNVARTTIAQQAWKRGQGLTVHGWIYGLTDGLVRDLNVSATGGRNSPLPISRRLRGCEAPDAASTSAPPVQSCYRDRTLVSNYLIQTFNDICQLLGRYLADSLANALCGEGANLAYLDPGSL
jgi:hypothetical protein